ncbi:MAG: aspartyl/glutamyl-tRNA amidotransferase subunit A [Bacilli bacterium]|jgi:aspartyl-tRNA(Asn)/glutamyl-tRNA(Gln) amidotransferase subunit A|nr:aspartyl/glutamyl-tRNA amidotransferase subunit A [Bacilli bacterium]
MNYLDLSLKELHEALVAKKVTPLELTKEALKRAHEDKDNAFEKILDKEAIEEASTLTEPEVDNYLWGIPYLAKDNFSTKGIETTASSNILNGYVPVFDATVIAKLKEKKAIMIAKTTMDELAMGGTGTTGHLGKTYNPYDPTHQRMIGGSSCGSAAGVASGIATFSLGSDTGDSVRKPAAYSGLVGMKPTWGRISRFGLFPFAPSLDHVGYFSRDVFASAVLLDVLAGRDDNDSTSSVKPVEKYEEDLLKPIKGYKVAVFSDIISSIKDECLLKHFSSSLKALESEGVSINYVNFGKELLESLYATYIVISCAEATSNDANLDGIKFGPYKGGKSYQEVMYNARTAGFSELIKRRFVIGSYCLMRENQEELFLRAQRNRAKIVERVNEILSENDFILLPSAPSIAPLFSNSSDKLSEEYLIADNHLCLGNFAGLPSISLPLAFEDNMPLSVNFMGRAFDEKRLFQIASVFEKLSGLANLSINEKKEGNL